MATTPDADLLMIGNQTVRSLKADKLTQESVPKGSWEVSYIVERSSLAFSIFLNYDFLIRNFAGSLADPVLWITIVALFAAMAVSQHTPQLPMNLRFSFVVNGGGKIMKDWKASCTVKQLLDAANQAEGKSLDEASAIMMTNMELESR